MVKFYCDKCRKELEKWVIAESGKSGRKEILAKLKELKWKKVIRMCQSCGNTDKIKKEQKIDLRSK